MPLIVKQDDYDELRDKVAGLFADMKPDLEVVGGIGADAIVRTTLAGIGEGDQPFAPYSEAYRQLIESVGGKAQGVVNLRGVFYKTAAGGKAKRKGETAAAHELRQRRKGALRRAYVWVKIRGRGFYARTLPTRPALGLTDRLSEMSRDLIRVEAEDNKLALVYEPRKEKYMILHQDGGARGGKKRVWFTLEKSAVKQEMISALAALIEARVAAFNGGT